MLSFLYMRLHKSFATCCLFLQGPHVTEQIFPTRSYINSLLQNTISKLHFEANYYDGNKSVASMKAKLYKFSDGLEF